MAAQLIGMAPPNYVIDLERLFTVAGCLGRSHAGA